MLSFNKNHMYKLIILVLLLFFVATTYSQATDTVPSLTKQDYLKKSKNQKTAAWIIGGGGVVLTAVGLVTAAADVGESFGGIFAPEVNDGGDSGGVFVIAGLAAVGTSVILFLASDKNKRKAATLTFSNQLVPQLNKGTLVNKPVPSLSLRIGL